jgi:hypothetical protein
VGQALLHLPVFCGFRWWGRVAWCDPRLGFLSMGATLQPHTSQQEKRSTAYCVAQAGHSIQAFLRSQSDSQLTLYARCSELAHPSLAMRFSS